MSASSLPLPPPPTSTPLPPSSPSPIESPIAVLPGDDLTHLILHSPPPKPPSSSGRKNKKSKKNKKNKKSESNTDTGTSTSDHSDDDDDELSVKLPPKIGTGLTCIYSNDSNENDNNDGIVRIQAIIAGRLSYRPSSRTWFVASNPRRYHLSSSASSISPFLPLKNKSNSNITSNNPQIAKPTLLHTQHPPSTIGHNDRLIGIIEDQKASADYYRVHVFGSHSALLHVLSFEGATKRNRPQLEPGCLVFCRVVKGFAGGRMEMEVSCKVGGSASGSCGGGNSSGVGLSSQGSGGKSSGYDDDGGASRKDWLTNEGTYGPLYGGTSFRISLGLARELLKPSNAVLDALDESGVPFEIAIGVNGLVWLNSPVAEYTIMVLNAIRNSEVMSEKEVRGMVKVMAKGVKKELEEA